MTVPIHKVVQELISAIKNIPRRAKNILISIYLVSIFKRFEPLQTYRLLRTLLRSLQIIIVYNRAQEVAYQYYRLHMILMTARMLVDIFEKARERNEEFPVLIEKFGILKRRGCLERCSKLRKTMDRREELKKEISSSLTELWELINKNVKEGLITVEELNLSMMRLEGKKTKKVRVYDYTKEFRLRELPRGYRYFPFSFVMDCSNVHQGNFHDYKKLNKKIEKAKRTLSTVKSLKEERQIKRDIVFHEVELADYKLALKGFLRAKLFEEIQSEFQVNKELLKCLQEIESALGFRLDIDEMLRWRDRKKVKLTKPYWQ